MTTQTLCGMVNHGHMHWRGDRGSGSCGTDSFDGPRLSDGSPIISGAGFTCEGCHPHDAGLGFFAGGEFASFENEPQIMKVPHFRNLYQKVGMFGMPSVSFNLPGDGSHTGDQVRGTGFLHDGSTDTLFRFFTADVFAGVPDPNAGFDGGNPQRRDMEQFMLAFDSDLAPIVGQQATLTSTNLADVIDRITLREERAGASFTSAVLGGRVTECDLVVHGRLSGLPRSFLYDPVSDTHEWDSVADPAILPAALRAFANTAQRRRGHDSGRVRLGDRGRSRTRTSAPWAGRIRGRNVEYFRASRPSGFRDKSHSHAKYGLKVGVLRLDFGFSDRWMRE